MAKKEKSNGKCIFCPQISSGPQMGRHLELCEVRKKAIEKGIAKAAGKSVKVFAVKVWATYDPDYWLFLEVQSKATLEDLDIFLRDIWTECCGHLSAFTIKGKRYTGAGGNDLFDSDEMGDRSMDSALSKVLSVGGTCHYEYDFGSTTDLDLKVLWEENAAANKNKVTLLARNEASAFKCADCGSPAKVICSECSCEKESSYCGKCASQHECGEEMCLPVVNSPRMGVCGYEG